MRLLPPSSLLLLLLTTACLLTESSASGRNRRQLGQRGSPCRTPSSQRGVCGTLHQCPDLLQTVSGSGRRSPQAIRRLKQFVCGRRRSQPLFCCPSSRPQRPQSAGQHRGPPESHPNRAIVDAGFQCGTHFDDRVVGGDVVPLGRYPFVAVLGYKDNGQPVKYECGGALISQQHVLTAAHCVANLPEGLRLTTVRLGEHDLTSAEDCQVRTDGSRFCNSPQDFVVRKQFVHEEYNFPNIMDNDIALLKLNRPVVEDHFVGKICLPFGPAASRDYSSVDLVVAGFGRTGPRESTSNSPVMLDVKLPGVRQQTCANILRRKGAVITSKHICAGGELGRDSCAGDSGGPLMVTTPTGPPYSIIGVVSFGAVRCGEGGIPSVNTRVSEYLNWILDRLDD